MTARTSWLAAAAGAFLLAGPVLAGSALAADPAPLHVDQSVAIDAPAAKVWAMVRDFGNMSWHPAIKQSTATDGNTPGSVRTLDLGGPKLVEQLASYDAAGMQYTYRITPDPANVKVLPVTHYESTISVKAAANNTCVVDWQGTFLRADPSATPAAGEDDAAALHAIGGVYGAGLAKLKTEAEAD